MGIAASLLCVVHCLFTPILLSFSAVAAHLLPGEERTHRTLAVVVAALGCIALLSGFRRHRRSVVLACTSAGLACIFGAAWFGDLLPAHAYEVELTCVGSALMIAAHRLNHTFCRNCTCVSAAPHDS